MSWKVNYTEKKRPKLDRPVLIEGLPGIGNVGKVAVDFLIEELKAKKLCSFFSYTLPHSVFVNESNLIELPTIELFYKKRGNGRPDLLILTGDVQPIEEVSSYDFCDTLLNLLEQLGIASIVTLGGIGLPSVPKNPNIYCTGNSKKAVDDFRKNANVKTELYGIVGPIIGVSGILLGLAGMRKIPAVALLAETVGNPLYLGVKGAREIVKALDSRLMIGVNMKGLDKEIAKMEKEIMKRAEELLSVTKSTTGQKLKHGQMSYIG